VASTKEMFDDLVAALSVFKQKGFMPLIFSVRRRASYNFADNVCRRHQYLSEVRHNSSFIVF